MQRKKTALITGITGQDGSYLAEFLLEKGYEVFGILRRSSIENTWRIDHLLDDNFEKREQFHIKYADLQDSLSIIKLLEKIQPDEIYNLGAQSDVKISFDIPLFTSDVVGLGACRILEAIRILQLDTRFYQASSSELFGQTSSKPQNENTPFNPCSPYAVAKLYAFHITKNYREAYGLHASNGILFNHESPRRGENFVTRKITKAVAKIVAKKQAKLQLGNIDAKRDWGYAKDYVEAMFLMLQQTLSDDYVIATGETHSVKEFVEIAFELVNLNWQDYVEINPDYFRPKEVDFLLGDCSKAKEKLNWKPKTSFYQLVKMMLEADLKEEISKSFVL